MKIFCSLLLALGIVGASTCAVAADPVDLSDKRGVVDPKDLKQHDPKPPKVEGKAPPPPSSEDSKQKERDENYTVHKTGEGHGGVPTSGGFKP